MSVAAAVAVLTRIPVPRAAVAGTASTGAAAFALVGAAVAAMAAIPILVLGPTAPTVAAILAVAVLAIVTGGLHLDGLADTTDALLAPDRDRAERARKDPAIGAGGAIALILVIAVEVAAIAALIDGRGSLTAGLALVAAGATSRGLAPLVVRTWRARATSDGFGAWFARGIGRREVALSVGSAVVVVGGIGLALGSPTIPLGALLGGLIGVGVGAALIRTRGQLDGDGMGATIELSAAAILVSVVAIAPIVGPVALAMR